ncbi:sulfur carrier protein ThiS [Corynebacterium suicordis]|uniref:Sulfur carrier protein ThiS n=1 Tax=Corynebacterium suicordis DSM 45110 TaxID=1121369 RepID=A0ABR9ZGY5_9CORY|nr:sulfur carrier protein ThiS [Corynebacterium suicordis]MBF4552676.1 sulfur carrier protein ThiS [Corynebacterium suicordis DSM 45110]MDR6278365.1 sulfur carrier protein [Corynebacterium suicordis]
MNVIVNEEKTELAEGATVADLVEHLTGEVAEAGVAVAVEGHVISRSQWQDTILEDGARVDVLTAVQGG